MSIDRTPKTYDGVVEEIAAMYKCRFGGLEVILVLKFNADQLPKRACLFKST